LNSEVSSTETNGLDSDNNGTTNDPDRCVLIYVRVSTNEQKENGRSIDSQIEELRSIINNDPDIELYQEPIRDEGETGTDFDREGIQKVSRLARHNSVTHLMVDTVDRIGRSVAETLMFVHELREKYDVKILTRTGEIDINKPTDRMEMTMLATMADFGTLNRARSSLRSSADNFIQNKQWRSWYGSIPFGYEKKEKDTDTDAIWIQKIEALEPVIEDIFSVFVRTESYAKTADIISEKHRNLLEQHGLLQNGQIDARIKSIVSRPLYRGKPTIPVTTFEHYDPYPHVEDPELQFVDEEISQQAEEIVDKIHEKNTTNEDLTIDPEDFPEEFDPHIVETVSPLVRLVCPDCGSDLIADGHQKKLRNGIGARVYKCTNDNCGHERRWPKESEVEMMEMLSKFDDMHNLL
jgi:DNA invertase Pin-like site-specific DNA recombinase/predicted RNA-binding Zn-ribbon protein involved in translation (DUF1610 family)